MTGSLGVGRGLPARTIREKTVTPSDPQVGLPGSYGEERPLRGLAAARRGLGTPGGRLTGGSHRAASVGVLCLPRRLRPLWRFPAPGNLPEAEGCGLLSRPQSSVPRSQTPRGCPSVLGPNQPPHSCSRPQAPGRPGGVRKSAWAGRGHGPELSPPPYNTPGQRDIMGTFRSEGPHCQAGGSGQHTDGGHPAPTEQRQQHKCHLIYMTKWHHYCKLTECRSGQFPKII